MIANYHTHTIRCQHASGEDKAYVEAAITSGMKVLGFSDHCPWIYNDGHVSGTRMLPSQLDDYFSSLQKLRSEYADDITIYIGFEAEYIPELIEDQNRLLLDYPVDYMILGQHFTAREPFAPYTGFPTDSEERLCDYVDTILTGMNTGKYSYVAHPDLFNFTGSDEIYKKHMGRLCAFLKEKNIPVEINMLGLEQGRHYPSERFFKIAKETGCAAIIGCDAHAPESLLNKPMQEKCSEYAGRFGFEVTDFLPNLGIK